MNALPPGETRILELVDIIEFKWLMGREGYRVHVERLQSDPAYAQECLSQAAASPVANIRASALRLMTTLGLPQGVAARPADKPKDQ